MAPLLATVSALSVAEAAAGKGGKMSVAETVLAQMGVDLQVFQRAAKHLRPVEVIAFSQELSGDPDLQSAGRIHHVM